MRQIKTFCQITKLYKTVLYFCFVFFSVDSRTFIYFLFDQSYICFIIIIDIWHVFTIDGIVKLINANESDNEGLTSKGGGMDVGIG